MGYFESDALEMLEVYLLETRQLNGQLAEILLEAEREGRFSESSIHSIFRVMHTIKSSSAMMGINGLSSLAHKLEDLFSYYRENMDKLEHPKPELFDLLFAASDFITQELEQMDREDYEPGDTSVLEQMTDDFLGHVSREEETDSGKDGNKPGEEDGREELPVIPELFVSKSGTVVNVTLEEGCRMEISVLSCWCAPLPASAPWWRLIRKTWRNRVKARSTSKAMACSSVLRAAIRRRCWRP